MEKILIKKHVEDLKLPEKLEKGDWIDLRAGETVFIREGETRLISLGISMKLPNGYEAHIVPRSSTFKNFGIILINSIGIIDNSYSGDNDIWKFQAHCLEARSIGGSVINKNDRICQFRIVKNQPEIEILEVEKLEDTNRGGIGSTGID